MRVHDSADHVSERGADWNRCEKNREHAPAFFFWKKIGEQRRRDCAVRGLADANGRARREQARESARPSAERSRKAPNADANCEQARPIQPIAERAEDR